MDNAVSMLKLQADLIDGEAKILGFAVIVCETHNLPETARSLRLSMIILRNAATLIRKEADRIGENNETA